MIFETSRLLVRPLRLDDFPTYFEMQGNPSIHKYTGSQVDDEATARAGLEKHIRCYSEPENGWWIWCVERKSDGVMVGTCAVIYSGNDIVGEGPEIGYRFLEKHWGNGYAAEICDPLIDHSLNTMKLPSVFATADVLNVASVKTLERSKLNFVAEYFNEKENCTDRVYFLRR
jgi:RimJ/RimL family protein N-acetyltransferase